ncbi:MAG: LysE family transporter, partial [Achromobacter sp.]|nr:LysE family transporter [Achromobacter sp.]
MTGWEVWMAFVGYAVPMIISPGPGNTLLATAGGRYGLRGSVPFWVGFEAANLALCALYGLGLGGALHEHPQIHVVLKWMGVLYLLYLAWGFFRASAKPASQAADTRPLGFVDGFICVILNPKIHSMIAVM